MRRLAAAVLLAASACAAHAEGIGTIYSAVTFTSDYRYRGVSSSDRQPALQGYAHLYRPDGWYAGVFVSQVDYGYAQSPDYEVDLYGGRNWLLDRGRTELKLEGLYTAFPDDRTPGPTLEFFQVKVGAKRTEGPLTYGAIVAVTPDASYVAGRGWRVEGEAAYQLNPHLTLRGVVGHQDARNGQPRSYWEFGAATKWKSLGFEVRYVDTDLSRRECGFNPDVCGATVVGSVTVSLPPIP